MTAHGSKHIPLKLVFLHERNICSRTKIDGISISVFLFERETRTRLSTFEDVCFDMKKEWKGISIKQSNIYLCSELQNRNVLSFPSRQNWQRRQILHAIRCLSEEESHTRLRKKLSTSLYLRESNQMVAYTFSCIAYAPVWIFFIICRLCLLCFLMQVSFYITRMYYNLKYKRKVLFSM